MVTIELEAFEWSCVECGLPFWGPFTLIMFSDSGTPWASCPKCDSNCFPPKKVKLQVVKED